MSRVRRFRPNVAEIRSQPFLHSVAEIAFRFYPAK